MISMSIRCKISTCRLERVSAGEFAEVVNDERTYLKLVNRTGRPGSSRIIHDAINLFSGLAAEAAEAETPVLSNGVRRVGRVEVESGL